MLLKQDYHYHLPDHLIAQQPLKVRCASRLLCLQRSTGQLNDSVFTRLIEYLRPEDLLVLNNTRVIPARLFANKITGGKVEILIERILDETSFMAQIRTNKALKQNHQLVIANKYKLSMSERKRDMFVLKLHAPYHLDQLLDEAGHTPLPPYIQREDTLADKSRYQTVFADQPGAAAAPTAGLHFDQALLDQIRKIGVDVGFVTLHVGAGTFQPMRVDRLTDHVMHSERIEVGADIVEKVCQAKARKGRVIAVGTTVVRALESASRAGQLTVFKGETQLFITPGYTFNCVDALLTNFHVSESTLLALVCAFGGYQQVMDAYHHAIHESYRFFSYGDAMFISDE
ncbi:MAG TPA: tRNA preQ1(34) S-adenosylmethionine ribosyltransferase-isomerase QueA [Crenotrichaceae bacterium]|nr:tRNA preQ1(34) S-adenosylmethionine ribosyltransferase-isomerase QueA [Crenotrichaceae bacterium]